MAIGVVDLFKVIDVYHEKSILRALAPPLVNQLVNQGLHGLAVVKAGERISFRAFTQHQLGLFSLVDVADIAKGKQLGAVRVIHNCPMKSAPDDVPGGVHAAVFSVQAFPPVFGGLHQYGGGK